MLGSLCHTIRNRHLESLIHERIELDEMLACLSTLGGAFSSLGDEHLRCVRMPSFWDHVCSLGLQKCGAAIIRFLSTAERVTAFCPEFF